MIPLHLVRRLPMGVGLALRGRVGSAVRFISKLEQPLDPVRGETTVEELNAEMALLFGAGGDESMGSGGFTEQGPSSPSAEATRHHLNITSSSAPPPREASEATNHSRAGAPTRAGERLVRMSYKEAARMNEALIRQQLGLTGAAPSPPDDNEDAAAHNDGANGSDDEGDDDDVSNVEVHFHPDGNDKHGSSKGDQSSASSSSTSSRKVTVSSSSSYKQRAEGMGGDHEDDGATHLHIHLHRDADSSDAAGRGRGKKVHLHLHL